MRRVEISFVKNLPTAARRLGYFHSRLVELEVTWIKRSHPSPMPLVPSQTQTHLLPLSFHLQTWSASRSSLLPSLESSLPRQPFQQPTRSLRQGRARYTHLWSLRTPTQKLRRATVCMLPRACFGASITARTCTSTGPSTTRPSSPTGHGATRLRLRPMEMGSWPFFTTAHTRPFLGDEQS